MNSLLTRVLSGIVAVLLLAGLMTLWGATGLRALVYLAPVLGVRELSRILFKPDDSLLIRSFFAINVLMIFYATLEHPGTGTLAFACLSILFISFSILLEKKFLDLTSLSLFQAKSLLGFFYLGVLPALAGRILDLNHGGVWFLIMLAVVFAGDTFAYVFGLLWGKRKLLPKISPKKTIIGSAGGLLGSILAAGIGSIWLPQAPLVALIFLGLLTGMVAQLGDLFESMLKRVANIKDSGSIMPGHGGVLDRLDGVLFGAPIFLFGSQLIEHLF